MLIVVASRNVLLVAGTPRPPVKTASGKTHRGAGTTGWSRIGTITAGAGRHAARWSQAARRCRVGRADPYSRGRVLVVGSVVATDRPAEGRRGRPRNDRVRPR